MGGVVSSIPLLGLPRASLAFPFGTDFGPHTRVGGARLARTSFITADGENYRLGQISDKVRQRLLEASNPASHLAGKNVGSAVLNVPPSAVIKGVL